MSVFFVCFVVGGGAFCVCVCCCCCCCFGGGGGGPLLLHFVNSCPPDADCAVTADRKDTDVSRLTSSLGSFLGHK